MVKIYLKKMEYRAKKKIKIKQIGEGRKNNRYMCMYRIYRVLIVTPVNGSRSVVIWIIWSI